MQHMEWTEIAAFIVPAERWAQVLPVALSWQTRPPITCKDDKKKPTSTSKQEKGLWDCETSEKN